MGALTLVIFYGSILFCIIVSAIKVNRYASAPLHLHWELYRGSSVYELTDWWDRPHSRFTEKLKSLAADLLFLRGYYQRDRKLWFFLYLFHIGIYLLIFWHAWLFVGAVTLDIEKASAVGRIGGHFATALAFVGGAGILIKRIADRDLRSYYPPIHYIKWILILITLLGGFYAVDVYFGGRMPELLKYVRDQVTFQDFQKKLHPSLATSSHVLFASLWLVYFPFSHIMKLFFRYYHQLRWDDVPNREGSLMESKIKGLLDRPVTWSGPHIPSGKKWNEVASGSGLENSSGKP
jgi:nitrate reductase gamma subunit